MLDCSYTMAITNAPLLLLLLLHYTRAACVYQGLFGLGSSCSSMGSVGLALHGLGASSSSLGGGAAGVLVTVITAAAPRAVAWEAVRKVC